MSALGHLQTCPAQDGMSASPLQADIATTTRNFGYGPLADDDVGNGWEDIRRSKELIIRSRCPAPRGGPYCRSFEEAGVAGPAVVSPAERRPGRPLSHPECCWLSEHAKAPHR